MGRSPAEKASSQLVFQPSIENRRKNSRFFRILLKGMESATEIALEIRAKIEQVSGLNASAGICNNKFLAMMARRLEVPIGAVADVKK